MIQVQNIDNWLTRRLTIVIDQVQKELENWSETPEVLELLLELRAMAYSDFNDAYIQVEVAVKRIKANCAVDNTIEAATLRGIVEFEFRHPGKKD